MSWYDTPPLEQYHCIQNGEDFAYIHKSAKIACKLSIGRFSYINSGAVFGGRFPVTIGNFCSIAADVYCWTYENHQTRYVTTFPLRTVLGLPIAYSEIDDSKKGVVIGHDVWIGHGARINPGVTIGNGCVIAARAVVTKDCEAYGIYGGVPAKLIRKRFSPQVIEYLESIKWWNWPLDKIKRNVDFFNLDLTKEENLALLKQYF